MGNCGRRVVVYCRLIVLYLLLSISTETVHSVPQTRRICLQYATNSNNSSELYNFEDKIGAIEITKCEKGENMCYILWKEDIKDGKILVKVLRRGCWRYENNEKESCNTTNCLSSQHSFGEIHFCCCQTDLCNGRFRTQNVFLAAEQNSSAQSTGTKYKQNQTDVLFLAGMILIGVFLLLLTCITAMSFFCKRRKITNKDPLLTGELSRPKCISPIHVGKFSEIWYGRVKSKAVAIKKFHSSSYDSWKQERQIYKLGLNHPGILKFFGAPILEETWNLSYILILEYHPRGSLRCVLQSNIISWQTMCTMGKSIAEALAYVHGEQEKTNFSCIVHRDLTSDNILVRANDTCVLCDFGIARVMSIQQQRSIVTHRYQQVGCQRHMAQEILEGRIDLNDITTQLKQIDIYALGTVLWAISSRCADICNGLEITGYRMPFHDSSSDMTMKNAENSVVENQQLSDVWNIKSQSLKEFKELISQCWDEEPEARLSATCVCHRINELQEHHKTEANFS